MNLTYDAAGNLATRTNNATGGTTTASVNALNQLFSGLGYTGFTHADPQRLLLDRLQLVPRG